MKSVFSAFKGRKPDSGGNSSSSSSKSNHNKNSIAYNENSYASLRKIREADPFTKMSIASGDELIDTSVRVTKVDANIAGGHDSPVITPINGSIECNQVQCPQWSHSNYNKQSSECTTELLPLDNTESNETDCQTGTVELNSLQFHSIGGLVGDTVTSLPPAKAPARPSHVDTDADGGHTGRVPVLSGDSNRLLKSGDLNTLRNKNNSNRLGKRLSLTGIGNNLLPTVHGRPKNVAEKTKTRFSHQRNLSLDFRSMGVLLPPVPQSASAHINLTQHHRNRSLDSALQRIPEVEVSSPTSESKSVLCKNAFLGSGMCSKSNTSPINTANKNETNPSSNPISKEPDVNIALQVHENVKKTSGDVSSLGSNDSGIICGSELDPELNFRTCRSRDSLESVETETECPESNDKNSAELSDASTDNPCYPSNSQSSAHDQNIVSGFASRETSLEESDQESMEKISTIDFASTTPVTTPGSESKSIKTSSENKTPVITSPNSHESSSKGVNFTNILGATKKVIFRTTQVIIDNHERKNALKAKIAATESDKKSAKYNVTNTSVNSETNITPARSPIEVGPLGSPLAGAMLNGSSGAGTEDGDELPDSDTISLARSDKCHNGLLRFLESPIFNIHFALHYLFYSKEPGVLSFIGNKIFSFKDQDVDLYIPQLILMYIQMNELAEVLDPYLVYRCRKHVDFCLKCLWLLEAYNYNADSFVQNSCDKKTHLRLMRQIYPINEKQTMNGAAEPKEVLESFPTLLIKTHHRSQSDATGLLNKSLTLNNAIFTTPVQLCLGDLASGRAFDNGCRCFESVRGAMNDLRGQRTECTCRAPKLAPQKEFMKSLIDIGRNLTLLPTKAEKNSVLRMRLNLINKNLPARVWLPLTNMPHHVVRIKEEKAAVLNSKDKTPYIIYVEVIEVNDTYTSAIIPKLMQTLRHTKSEEHLQSNMDESDDGEIGMPSINHQSQWNINRIGSNAINDDIWSDEFECQKENFSGNSSTNRTMLKSSTESDLKPLNVFNIGDVRNRHSENLTSENSKPFFGDPEDPSAAVLKEPWNEKERQIKESSPYGHLSNWRLLSAIVKSGDDLRQELMATQLLEVFKLIWEEENVNLWVRPYKIVCLSNDSGLIEPILNTVSLHQIRKHSNKSLREYFVDEYGDPEGERFQTAQNNFMQSCAAYCLISYLLQVKDRHNGNILLHSDGHLIHIDFGFILSISPKNLGFEQSPFKLTPEFVDVIGGFDSELWRDFEYLLLKGVMAARKHMDRIINVVEIMRSSGQLPCFKNGYAGTVQNLRNRFHMNLTEHELARKMEQLVQDSLNSLSQKLYDGYQYWQNGIL